MAKPKSRRNGFADNPGRVASAPGVCSGKPCVRGARIPVHIALDLLAADESIENILLAYPNITRDDVRACIDRQ